MLSTVFHTVKEKNSVTQGNLKSGTGIVFLLLWTKYRYLNWFVSSKETALTQWEDGEGNELLAEHVFFSLQDL